MLENEDQSLALEDVSNDNENKTPVQQFESLQSKDDRRRFYEGDIVIKNSPVPEGWSYIPYFGTILRQPNGNEENELGESTYNVRWEMNNGIERVRADQISLVDRLLLRSSKVESSAGEIGTVNDWNVTTSVQIIGTNHVVEKIGLDRLRPITSFIRGQEILYKDWIGVITTVKRNIWFLLDGGMGFYVPVTESDGFMRTDPYWGVGMPCPGIRTKLSSAIMRTAKWTSGPMRFFSKVLPPLSYLYSMAHVTLNRSEVTEVEVKWLQKTPASEDSPAPPTSMNREMLRSVTVVGVPSSETVGINSVRLLKLRPEDSITNYPSWLQAFQARFLEGKENAQPSRAPVSATAPLRVLATERVYEVPVKVLLRQTNLDVAWNDGTIERVNSIRIPKLVARMDDKEFPHGMVVSPLYTQQDLMDHYGVVVDSDALAQEHKRKVNVVWILNGNYLDTTVESVFDLKPHPHYSMYERGTIVLPRSREWSKFKAAVVSDLNVSAGKMVLTVSADQLQHEVYPHHVTLLSRRCFWNFFTKQWAVDDIIYPPYQLHCEYSPMEKYLELEPSSPDLLGNNNQSERNAWDELAFDVLAFAPDTHRYYKSAPGSREFGKKLVELMGAEFVKLKLHQAIPDGIWIRCYENRLDLVSILMLGPAATPYEDGIFMFDLQLSSNFPSEPPKIHHVSYSYEINPNMSWDGNFCVSGLEWNAKRDTNGSSYIAYCAKLIQGLIFSPNPLLHGFKEHVDHSLPEAKRVAISRMYNEFVVMRVLDASWNTIHRPHDPWTNLIRSHFASVLPEKLAIMESWDLASDSLDNCSTPSYPLVPVSEGFAEAFSSRLEKFKKISPKIGPLTGSNPKLALTDTTADSESVPVLVEAPIDPVISKYEPDVSLELVDVQFSNANSIVEETGRSKSSSSTTSGSARYDDSTSALDSQKNVVRKKRSKKGKLLRKMLLGGRKNSASSGSASESEEVAKEETN